MPDDSDTVVSLIDAIDQRIQRAHTQSKDLSFNELYDMFKSEPKELDITPDYQRLFRWSPAARSRFIESLLIEMPVPPIFVIEEASGMYTLIDGLQRISSYLHLRGELEAPHLDPPIKPGDKLRLVDCDIVEELNGRTWDDLGSALQIRLKRAFVRVEVVRKTSDPRFKYHMFKRLNTGGVLLTDHQIRNCTIRLLDPAFNNFIAELSELDVFKSIVTELLTPNQRFGAFDQELVLRFFALRNRREEFKHEIGDFLTEYMEAVSDPTGDEMFDMDEQRRAFEKTFAVLGATLGERAFGFPSKDQKSITRGFSTLRFEAFTIGLQSRLDRLDRDDAEQMKRLNEVLRPVQLDRRFIDLTTGGGKNSPGPLKARIEFVQERVEAAF